MNENRRASYMPVVLAVIVTALLTFWGTYLLIGLRDRTRPATQTDKPAQTQSEDQTQEPTSAPNAYAEKLAEMKRYIDAYFIGEVNEKQLADAAAAGMIEGLNDEWSYYISAEDYSSYLENVTNSYVGIGVTISGEDVELGVEITEVMPDSPAYEAGLQKGDLILAVEGAPIRDGSEDAIDMTETKNRVRGEEGTDVTLTVSHEGETRDVTITRATIKTVNVTSELMDNGLMYIHIRNFELNAAKDTIDAIEAAVEQNAKGIIFDVRFNPGGYKNELVQILDVLLPEGPLFRSVNFDGTENVDESDADHIELPMAVLVNYDSYSAAEFFAAALQEYDAAKIVGAQTYGKGRFQTVFRLADGSAINISIGQYTTPNGVSLVGKGITPDYPVELTEEELQNLYYGKLAVEDDKQLQKAIEVLTNE